MKKRLVLMALLLSVSPSNAASAQISESALSGKIVTTTNKPVPNLHLTVKNTANDETQFVAVSKDGSFTIYNLAPGIYEITASATGFKPSTESVAIRPGAGQVANIVMQPEATGTGQGGTSGVSGTVSSKNVSDLPLNGRSASDLATLEPGVTSARTQASGQAQRGFGNQMTISGGRPRQNDAR